MTESLRGMLLAGDRRTIGRANEAAHRVLENPRRITHLIDLLFDANPNLRMRAADAAEKVSRERPDLLTRYKLALLELAAMTDQQEIRWHLTAMIPRLKLTGAECERAAELFRAWLNDRSSIVKTSALQALFDLSPQWPALQAEVVDLLQALSRSGTPAMRARGRILLKRLGVS